MKHGQITNRIVSGDDAGNSSSPVKVTETKNMIDIDSKEFHDSVTRAVRMAKKNGGWISYKHLPTAWRINPYILHGYRFTPSLAKTALSAFLLSNETANIWTHLVPAILLLRYPLSLTPVFQTFRDGGLSRTMDAYVAWAYFACTAASLLCSASWHSARCSSRVRVMASFVSVDIMSISLTMTAFNVVYLHTVFYLQPHLRSIYTALSMAWLIAGLLLPWTNAFRPANVAPWKVLPPGWPLPRGWNRVLFFIMLGFQGSLVPMVHSIYVNGWEYTSELSSMLIPVHTPMFLGSLLYGSKFPERFWPGKFDFLGCSHNIWHVATAITALNGCDMMLKMFELAWSRDAE